jgi:hypothetical protein
MQNNFRDTEIALIKRCLPLCFPLCLPLPEKELGTVIKLITVNA